MKQVSVLLSCLLLFTTLLSAQQSKPTPLRTDIKIRRLMTVRNGVVRMSRDPTTGDIFYLCDNGNICEIIGLGSGSAYDTVRFKSPDYGIDYAQCMFFHDSTLFVSGNNTPYKPTTTGIIRRGDLQSNGTRIWTTVMSTEPYKTGDYYDHLLSGMVLSPAGDSITFCSGARGDHGEIQTLYGRYPTARNEPLTARTFRVPANSYTYLKNDSDWLDKSVYSYALGTRNNFDMAYDANGNLFGLENSDSRDDNEEMNWLRRGRHYGFPYKIGDNYNPQQFKWFDPAKDKLINHYTRAWRLHFFSNDPSFPPAPKIQFEAPIQNIGPDADKFRDSATGKVKDASDLGLTIGTFSAHRSPLGLVFDNRRALAPDFRGDAFMLSWTTGYDSCGCTTVPDSNSGTFVDPSQDMVHLHLIYDSTNDRYKVSATRVIADFANPVDALIDFNIIYVIENGYSNSSGLYEVTMPATSGIEDENALGLRCSVYPNPASDKVNFYYNLDSKENCSLAIFDIHGRRVIHKENIMGNTGDNRISLSTSLLAEGVYFYEVKTNGKSAKGKLAIIR